MHAYVRISVDRGGEKKRSEKGVDEHSNGSSILIDGHSHTKGCSRPIPMYCIERSSLH